MILKISVIWFIQNRIWLNKLMKKATIIIRGMLKLLINFLWRGDISHNYNFGNIITRMNSLIDVFYDFEKENWVDGVDQGCSTNTGCAKPLIRSDFSCKYWVPVRSSILSIDLEVVPRKLWLESYPRSPINIMAGIKTTTNTWLLKTTSHIQVLLIFEQRSYIRNGMEVQILWNIFSSQQICFTGDGHVCVPIGMEDFKYTSKLVNHIPKQL